MKELLRKFAADGDLRQKIEVVDVGASNVNAGEIPPYMPLLEAGLARLSAFEPNVTEFEKLVSTEDKRYLPYGIGDGSETDLNITVSPGFCSTLQPDKRVNSFIRGFAKRTRITKRERIKTSRIDDISEIGSIDFLKIDIQGGEVAAFAGATRKLAGCLCVQTEVAFLPIYQDQPMFEQQNEILSRNGLRFFGMKSINSFPFEGTLRRFAGRRRRGDIGQWIDGDAVFLRDFMTWEELSNEQLLKLLLILAGCFSATSACSRLARILTQRGVLRPDAEHDLTMAFS